MNEKEYAERCLETGELDAKPYRTLQILAKYYFHKCGYKKKKIESLLTDYMKNNYPRYSVCMRQWADSIEKIASRAGKYPLYEITEIWITESELETIDKLATDKHKKVAFTMLCLAKFGNIKNSKNNNWVNNDTAEIFKLANVSITQLNQDNMIGDLMLENLLELATKNDNLSNRVTFVDDNSKKVFAITELFDLGYEYLLHRGDNYIRCQSCGKIVKGNKNGTRKYCNNCSAKQPMETKTIHCVDCGKKLVIKAKNTKTTRCLDCQHEKDKSDKREWIKKNR